MCRPASDKVYKIIEAVRVLAIEYFDATGKPLGVKGEIAEYEASRLLGLELCTARQSGFDAWMVQGDTKKKVQIKGRRVKPPLNPGTRIGRIDLTKEWDSVMLVLLDERYSATEIYEADRDAVERALKKPGSKARNERGQLGVSGFKSIAERRWPQ